MRGTDLSADEEQALATVEASLPDGWRIKELRHQLVGRRPVKHETYGAVVKGPDRTIVALALDGVWPVQAAASAASSGVETTAQWAPPPITPADDRFREPWAPLAETDEEQVAYDALAEAALPEGAVLSPADRERFGPLTVFGVTVHLPDQTGVAAFGLDAVSAFDALGARLRGELAVSEIWFPPTT